MTFKDFENFMTYVEGITYNEATELNIQETPLVEEYEGFLAISGCNEGAVLAKQLAEKHNLKILTESFEDLEDGGSTVTILPRFMFIRNRVRFYLAKTAKEAKLEEIFEGNAKLVA